MPTTLVSFATAPFRHRQLVLCRSGKSSGGVDRVEPWNPRRLLAHGFADQCPEISLAERGAGYWSWKPFIIARTLESLADGELVLYCDVGRHYPWKRLDRPIDRLVTWMDERGQDLFPGVQLPWDGRLARWTKRYVFVHTNADTPEFRDATPVQASFLVWRKTAATLALARAWFGLCRNRRLVSDDPVQGFDNPEDYREHRHDQSLWTILCVKHGLEAYRHSDTMPRYDDKNPAEIAGALGEPAIPAPRWLRGSLALGEALERVARRSL